MKSIKIHSCPSCGVDMELEKTKVRPYKGTKKKWICPACDLEDTLYADHEDDLLGAIEEEEHEKHENDGVMCRHNIPIDECLICNE